MAETFRAPKAVQEEASLNSGWEKITQPVDIHDVLAIRQSWQGENGRVWAEKIIDNLAVRAANARALSLMASKEGDMTEVSDLNEELTELLADIVSFYFRAHGAHWNVTGTDFAEYHALFNEIYEDVYGSIDPLAENLRKLGIKAPFTLPQFIALRTLDDSSTNSSDARVLATDLLAANDAIVNGIAEAFDSAQEANQQGIANFLADRLDKHQFWKWQLTASLGEEVANPTPVEPAEDIAEEGVETDESTYPMPIAGRSASGASDLPLADRERAWDASAADKRVQDWAGGKDSMDWAKYGKAFLC
jgi:starvation-inducible DNA-binding protein